MITKDAFQAIYEEVTQALKLTLANLAISDPENYVLLLADGHYDTTWGINPDYVIDHRVDGYMDESRFNFLMEFLNNYYHFKHPLNATDDNQYRMNIEMMVYSHIWEATSFLRKLFRLAALINQEAYPWNVTVPPMGKHDFIRNEIRKKFYDNNSPLGDIIKNGFHTSLRNAFAHSDYSFDTLNNVNRINLYNYGGQEWELQMLQFNDWSKRFVYSAVLSFKFHELTSKARRNLPNDFGTNIFLISYPTSTDGVQKVPIEYVSESNGFNFYKA